MSAVEKTPEIQADSLLTSYQVGTLLQVNPSSVNKWVKDGRIPAFRTPGGHRRIRAVDVVNFLNAHQMPIPEGLLHAAQRRLLLADDDAHTVERIRFALKPYEHLVRVVHVGNSVDALVQVGAMRPHVMVLGAGLGPVDGFEVCRRLKAAAETKTVKVVLLGNAADDATAQRAGEAGASNYAARPLDVARVLHELGLADLQVG